MSLDVEKSDFEPLFIVGCPRSGTTLLSALLDRNSQIAATPETHFFSEFLAKHLRSSSYGNHEALLDDFWCCATIQDLRLVKSALLKRFERWPAHPKCLCRAMLEEYSCVRHKPRVVEKSPAHLKYVPLILRWYPRAKIVCCVRDGRDVALSLMKMPWAPNSLALNAVAWNIAIWHGARWQRKYPQSMATVRYERLVQDPKRELTKLHDFLQIPFEHRQLDSRVSTAVVPDRELEWKLQAAMPLDSSRVARWKRHATPEQGWLLNALMARNLKKLKYDQPTLDGCPLRPTIALYALGPLYHTLYSPGLRPLLRRFRRLAEKAGIPTQSFGSPVV